MLVDVNIATSPDPIIKVLSDNMYVNRLGLGLYEIRFWNFEMLVPHLKLEIYPDERTIEAPFAWSSYGVCDYPQQVIEHLPWLETSERQFVISYVYLPKNEEPESGGWRWHKWGPYIGKHEPKYEYLAQEPDIEEVWTYHIYEILGEK